MKKFSFTIDMVADDLDIQSVRDGLALYCQDNHSEIVSQVKSAGVKAFSEQGFKVWRARVTGITAKQAGDAHNPKVAATTATESTEA